MDCRKNKRNTASAQQFEQNLERNLAELAQELRDGSYRPGRSVCFVITHPKPREVWAATFRDRVVHHLLYNQVAGRFIKSFVHDSCACIPGRGTLFGSERLEHHIRSATQNWSRPQHYLKMDLANFFVSIDKDTLRAQLAKKITDPWWLRLAEVILYHDPREDFEFRGDPALMNLVPKHKRLTNAPANTGLPIGNLSSQFFANVLLDRLDQFVKHHLKVKHYVRYVDDFILLDSDPKRLNSHRQAIEAFTTSQLKLQVNPRKTILQPVERGVDFVGHVIHPWHTMTRKRTVNNACRRIETAAPEDLLPMVNSYLGTVSQATHAHGDRARIAAASMKRGHCVRSDLRKAYRAGAAPLLAARRSA
jgi:RNA-directed DNA polymerase